MVEGLGHIPLRAALCEHAVFDLQSCWFEFLDEGLDEFEVEDSEFEFSVLCGVVGEFGIDWALEFAGVVVDIALYGMGSSWMLEEGRDIESAVSKELVLLFELKS